MLKDEGATPTLRHLCSYWFNCFASLDDPTKIQLMAMHSIRRLHPRVQECLWTTISWIQVRTHKRHCISRIDLAICLKFGRRLVLLVHSMIAIFAKIVICRVFPDTVTYGPNNIQKNMVTAEQRRVLLRPPAKLLPWFFIQHTGKQPKWHCTDYCGLHRCTPITQEYI